jgi:probable rRNA maturation factor
MIEVEVFGVSSVIGGAGPDGPGEGAFQISQASVDEMRRLCVLAAGSAGFREGHIAIEFVDAERIAELNAEHRGEPKPTDVLAFPIDGVEPEPRGEVGGESGEARGRSHLSQRELGDVVICPEHTSDVREAIIHGVLHLVGMDHESDEGEMLARQRELLARARS